MIYDTYILYYFILLVQIRDEESKQRRLDDEDLDDDDDGDGNIGNDKYIDPNRALTDDELMNELSERRAGEY